MSGQVSVFPESIDEVLTAVQETPRGRWFLDAYAARVKSDGTDNILSAIAKLENTITAMAIGGSDAGLVRKAKDAIASAKREIALLEPQTANLSAEGQMFAKLADLSRQAFAGQNNKASIGQGVDRVLKLVSDLDQSLSGQTKPAVQYFKQDEAIFEPSPTPVIAVVPVAPTLPTAEPVNKGAKLVIHRVSQVQRPEPAAMESTTVEAPEPSRIVIIRKKAEDIMSVPLLDEPVENASAA
jgi:hypothetical protein